MLVYLFDRRSREESIGKTLLICGVVGLLDELSFGWEIDFAVIWVSANGPEGADSTPLDFLLLKNETILERIDTGCLLGSQYVSLALLVKVLTPSYKDAPTTMPVVTALPFSI